MSFESLHDTHSIFQPCSLQMSILRLPKGNTCWYVCKTFCNHLLWSLLSFFHPIFVELSYIFIKFLYFSRILIHMIDYCNVQDLVYIMSNLQSTAYVFRVPLLGTSCKNKLINCGYIFNNALSSFPLRIEKHLSFLQTLALYLCQKPFLNKIASRSD